MDKGDASIGMNDIGNHFSDFDGIKIKAKPRSKFRRCLGMTNLNFILAAIFVIVVLIVYNSRKVSQQDVIKNNIEILQTEINAIENENKESKGNVINLSNKNKEYKIVMNELIEQITLQESQVNSYQGNIEVVDEQTKNLKEKIEYYTTQIENIKYVTKQSLEIIQSLTEENILLKKELENKV